MTELLDYQLRMQSIIDHISPLISLYRDDKRLSIIFKKIIEIANSSNSLSKYKTNFNVIFEYLNNMEYDYGCVIVFCMDHCRYKFI